jgi:hypothetical protein
MAFPHFVFRAGGYRTLYKGKPYEYKIVADQDELDRALASGWHLTRDDALFPKPEQPSIVAIVAIEDAVEAPTIDEKSPPTRAEMEHHALSIGVKLDRRWSDKRLLAEIDKVSP